MLVGGGSAGARYRVRCNSDHVSISIPSPVARSDRPGVKFHHAAVIPLVPSWPGFLADTAIYASLWWGLLAGIPAARRTLRRRRGLCINCKYHVKDLAICPECGTPV